MSLTNYPNGVSSFGVPVVPDESDEIVTGNVYFVCATAKGKWIAGVDDPSYGTITKPFASIDYAIGKCTANQGDVIYVLPGHTESVAEAGGIAIDVAGISIIGLGSGSLRPTITLGTADTASITMSAANTTIKNFIFSAHLDNIATCFTVSAKDCTIDKCEFRDESDALHFLSCILTNTTNNGCDGLTVTNCKRSGLAAAATAFISILANEDRVTLTNNLVVDAGATGDVGHFLIMAAKVVTNAEISHNKLILPACSAIAVGAFMTGSSTTSTGVVHNNYVHLIDTTSAIFCTATLTFGLFENYQSGLVNGSGLLWPAADTPS
jgi:hypothetical protein